jgi:hypothetical protein
MITGSTPGLAALASSKRTFIMAPGPFGSSDRLPQANVQANPIGDAAARPLARWIAQGVANQVVASAMSDADAKIYRTAHAEAHRRGYLAARRSCTHTDNPYENDSPEARPWIRGLLEGRTKRTLVHSS